ncbi:MAG: GTPase, partial [Verrucomicrobiota bacterium]
MPSGCMVELHGACAGSYEPAEKENKGFLYIRNKKRCFLYSGAEPPAPGTYEANTLHKGPALELYLASLRFLDCWLEYERWISVETPSSWREEVYEEYSGLPSSPLSLPPREAGRWLTEYQRNPARLATIGERMQSEALAPDCSFEVAASSSARESNVPDAAPKILAIGVESVGKTQLLSRICGRSASPENFRGSTLACQSYEDGDVIWVDTPGIYRDSETEASLATVSALRESDQVLLVLRADRACEQLETLLPLIEGKNGFAVLTFADRLAKEADRAELERDFRKALGVPVFLTDARRFDDSFRQMMREAATAQPALRFQKADIAHLSAQYPSESGRITFVEKAVGNPLIALLLLLLPAAIAVTQANRLADWLYGPVSAGIGPLQSWIERGPAFVAALFAGEYGLVSMFPFLLLYALPTILVFSGILAVYKSTGLIDRLSVALHPWLRRFDEIIFVDLPHAGARYEIFKLHLAKYFPGLDFCE